MKLEMELKIVFFTLAIFYLLPGGQTSSNTAATPSDGPMRFFPVILLMFSVYYFAHKNLSTQLLIALPIWLVGVLWSIESTIFVTVVLGAWLRQHLRQSRGGLFQQTARRRCVYERRGVMPNASRRRLPFSSSTPDAYEKRNV